MIKLSKFKIIITFVSLIYIGPGFKTMAQGSQPSMANLGKQTVLKLKAGPNNPRNSEGDFTTLKDGKILFIYSHFTGKSSSDHASAYLASRNSTDNGKTWSKEDRFIVGQEGDMNVMSVSLLRLRNGSIALFYLRKNSMEDLIPMLRISNDETKTWTNPSPCITDRKGYFVLNNNRVIQLRNGRLLMPVALHKVPGDAKWSSSARIYSYYSDDNGKTWISSKEVPNPDKVTTQEPGIIEQNDGNILMFIRSSAGVQYYSRSTDKGETWSASFPSAIKSPLSPASIARIPSTGDLLMVWNNNGINQKRTPMNIAISNDDGKTWGHMKTLEDNPNSGYCYTAIHFKDKNVLLGYCGGSQSDGILNETDIVRLRLEWIYEK